MCDRADSKGSRGSAIAELKSAALELDRAVLELELREDADGVNRDEVAEDVEGQEGREGEEDDEDELVGKGDSAHTSFDFGTGTEANRTAV